MTKPDEEALAVAELVFDVSAPVIKERPPERNKSKSRPRDCWTPERLKAARIREAKQEMVLLGLDLSLFTELYPHLLDTPSE